MEEVNKFCELLMFLHPPWEVTSVACREGGQDRSPGRVMIEMAYRRGQLVPCPECGKLCKRHDTKQREWRDLDLMGWRTVLRAAVPRAKCPAHGVRQIRVPWAESRSHLTMRLESEVIDDHLSMNLYQVARKHGLSWDQVNGVVERAVRRGLARRAAQSPRRIGIDETSFQKRHEYVSVVVNHAPAKVLYVADGKGRDAIDPFFQSLGPEACERIDAVASDFAPAYLGAAQTYTNADLCIDRFHVVKLILEAVDQVRRTENKASLQQGDPGLKGTRFDWLMGPQRLHPHRRQHLEALRRQYRKVGRAWELKEQAAEIWTIREPKLAYRAWEAWYQSAMRSRLTPLMKAARTIWKYVEEIINGTVRGMTNALSESINSKIQWIKRQACGYRNRERFRLAIYFHLGKLDLYPRPAFHTES
ncbi:MAG: ISL3 family transposase [Gammaproteobacteria bacterium]|nr:ISL3 family transposase [Gammaproteobacteria bacterium]